MDREHSFWDFKADNKLDILTEKRHLHIVRAAIRDRLTGIQRSQRQYLLYGPDEALVVSPTSFCTFLALEFFLRIFNILGPITDRK